MLDKMLKALDAEPWATWLVTADAMEEAGDPRAAGLRELAKHRHYPSCINYKQMSESKPTIKWCWHRHNRNWFPANTHAALPFKVYSNKLIRHYDRYESDGTAIHFDSVAAAVLAAAESWSMLLKKKA